MKIIGLIDCNNFFVSCERVFNPKIRNRPAMVLSGNDGCVVARSAEVKKLGIKTGEPVFKLKNLIQKEKINLISGNLELYRDMSRRVMNVVREFTDEVEVYSIDEVFIDLSQVKNTKKFSKQIEDKIMRYTGVPVSIGIAPTKTLAKLANKIAKKNNEVFYINNKKTLKNVLQNTRVEDVWGIGLKNAEKLENAGIKIALQFCEQNDDWIHKKFSIRGLEMARELRGELVDDISPTRKMRKSIISSKSFSEKVFDQRRLEQSIVGHIEKATKQLREEGGVAKTLKIYISTGLYQKSENYYGEDVVEFQNPIDDTIQMTKRVTASLSKIYKKGFGYKKSGICLSGIILKEGGYETDLFGQVSDEYSFINQTVDRINERYGPNTIKVASAGVDNKKSVPKWISNPKFRSPNYTTCWEEIPSID